MSELLPLTPIHCSKTMAISSAELEYQHELSMHGLVDIAETQQTRAETTSTRAKMPIIPMGACHEEYHVSQWTELSPSPITPWIRADETPSPPPAASPGMNVSAKRELLAAWADRWATLTPVCRRLLTYDAMISFPFPVGGMLFTYDRDAVPLGGMDWGGHNVAVPLPSASDPDPAWRAHKLPLPDASYAGCARDPSQDLLVLLQGYESGSWLGRADQTVGKLEGCKAADLRVLSISTGKPHPGASQSVLPIALPPSLPMLGKPRHELVRLKISTAVQVMGDTVAVSMTWQSEEPDVLEYPVPEICLWNWKTGEIRGVRILQPRCSC